MASRQAVLGSLLAALALMSLAGCESEQCLALPACTLNVNVRVPAQPARADYEFVVRYDSNSFRARCLDGACMTTGVDTSAEWIASTPSDLALKAPFRGGLAPETISVWATRNGLVVSNATVTPSRQTRTLCGSTCTNATAEVTLSP